MNFQAVKSFKTTKKAPVFTHVAGPLDHEPTVLFSTDSCSNVRLHSDNGAVLLTNFMAKPQKVQITALSYNIRHNIAIVGHSNGELVFFKQSGKENNSKTFKPHNSRINYIEASSDQNRIITCSNDKVVKVYELKRSKTFVKPVFAASVSSHTGFVLKATLSDNLFSVYSIDPRVFRITDMRNKADTCVYEVNTFKGLFQGFFEMRDGLVLLQYDSRNFEVLDSRINQVVKSFKVDAPSILKTAFANEAGRLLILGKQDTGKQSLMVLDVSSGDKQEFSISFEVLDVICDRKGGKFVISGAGDIVLYSDQSGMKDDGNAKPKVKLELGSYNNISCIMPRRSLEAKPDRNTTEESELTPDVANPAIKSEAYALLVNKLGRYAASVQQITESLKLLDDKIERNEATVQVLNKDIELIMRAREAQRQALQQPSQTKEEPVDSDLVTNTLKEESVGQVDEPAPKESKTLKEPQVKIEYQPFLTLKEQMQADLDLLRNFVADKDTGSERMVESNFSFMKNDSCNVFDNVIGHKLKEDTANFVGISQNVPRELTQRSIDPTQYLATDDFNYTMSNLP